VSIVVHFIQPLFSSQKAINVCFFSLEHFRLKLSRRSSGRVPGSSRRVTSIIVVLAVGLEETLRNLVGDFGGDLVTSHQWACNEGDKNGKNDKVEDSIADDTAFAQSRLLKGVNGRANLAAIEDQQDIISEGTLWVLLKDIPWTKPEEHDRVKFIAIRDQDSWKHDEHDEMPEHKVSCKEPKFCDLAEILSSGLRY
jgi:hypothetical protein